MPAARTSFDIGRGSLKEFRFGAEGGELNYYILAGPTPADVLGRYRELFPFMRAHAELSAPHKEPWVYGPEHETYNRHAIERRYELLPYIYNCFYQSSETGMPMMRALMLEYPDDSATYSLTNEYLFGPDLLVAPILTP